MIKWAMGYEEGEKQIAQEHEERIEY